MKRYKSKIEIYVDDKRIVKEKNKITAESYEDAVNRVLEIARGAERLVRILHPDNECVVKAIVKKRKTDGK
jgi:hypothetical protein